MNERGEKEFRPRFAHGQVGRCFNRILLETAVYLEYDTIKISGAEVMGMGSWAVGHGRDE